jgi:hypothetical protein
MKALLWKEWRQAGPAHFLVAVVIAGPLILALPPERVLLPSHWHSATVYLVWAIVAIVEGFLLGLLQHSRERVQGTEAYLVQRASGQLRAFAAKVACGIAALTLAVSLPPLAYFFWHVVVSPTIENPLNERLGHFLVVGACSLPAYALGAFTAQLRKGWWSRLLLGFAGCLSLLFAVAVASQTPAGADRTPIGPYLAVQLVLASVWLAGAYCLFRAGEDDRPWPRRQALAAAVLFLPLILLPWLMTVATVQTTFRFELLGTYPQIVEDADRALYLVRRVPPSGSEHETRAKPRFELFDAQGSPLRDERIQSYRGFGQDFDPFLTLFDASTTPLRWVHPQEDTTLEPRYRTPFGFDGVWIPLQVANTWPWNRWFRPSDGTVHFLGSDPDETSRTEQRTRRVVLTRPDTGKGFSPSTLVHSAWFKRPLSGFGGESLLIDLQDHTLWHSHGSAAGLYLEPILLPQRDELVGTERLYSFAGLRAGLYDRTGDIGESVLLVGKEGRYLWHASNALEPIVDRLQLPSDFGRQVVPESDAGEVIAWRLEPARVDGLGVQLDVLDVESNQVALSHDFRPESTQQKRLAAQAWLTSLLRAPGGSLWTYFAAQHDPRDVNLPLSSYFRDPLLLGGAHTLLLGTSVAVGCLLAALTWRRLGRDPRDRAVRWTWTIAVFAFGVAAWLLCWMLEPSRRRLAARMRRQEAIGQPLIQSPRSTSVREPALSSI